MKIETFQEKDIVLKQGTMNSKIFIIINGDVEVINEEQDYNYFDIEATGTRHHFDYYRQPLL